MVKAFSLHSIWADCLLAMETDVSGAGLGAQKVGTPKYFYLTGFRGLGMERQGGKDDGWATRYGVRVLRMRWQTGESIAGERLALWVAALPCSAYEHRAWRPCLVKRGG